MSLQKRMSDAIGFRSIVKRFEQLIILNDGNPINKDIYDNLPRKARLNRLSQFYGYLVDFSLRLINTYYWLDDVKLEQSFWNLEECLKHAIPTILHMKNTFENFVHNELKRKNTD